MNKKEALNMIADTWKNWKDISIICDMDEQIIIWETGSEYKRE